MTYGGSWSRVGLQARVGSLTHEYSEYFTQAEIKAFLAAALDEEPIPVAPGVLYVFRNFTVDDEDMREVARWIVANTPFDRLYFYGDDLPVHVSYGPQQSRQVVRMVPGPSGRLVPRVVSREEFLVTP